MAHRNQIGSTLGAHEAGQTRYLQRLALGIRRQGPQHLRFHRDERTGLGLARGLRFSGHIDHAGPAFSIVMRELLRHEIVSVALPSRRLSWGRLAPTAEGK